MRQFKIGTRSFCVIATYGIYGFICWRIFEGIVTSEEFQDYLTNTLSYYIDNNMVTNSVNLIKLILEVSLLNIFS